MLHDLNAGYFVVVNLDLYDGEENFVLAYTDVFAVGCRAQISGSNL